MECFIFSWRHEHVWPYLGLLWRKYSRQKVVLYPISRAMFKYIICGTFHSPASNCLVTHSKSTQRRPYLVILWRHSPECNTFIPPILSTTLECIIVPSFAALFSTVWLPMLKNAKIPYLAFLWRQSSRYELLTHPNVGKTSWGTLVPSFAWSVKTCMGSMYRN